MLIKIDIYTLRLIKENFLYLFLLLFSALIIFFLIFYQINNFSQYTQKINLLNKEIGNLEKKDNVLSTLKPNDINQLIFILDQLLPGSEDYFSIIYALETISQKSGFRITSYSISLNDQQKDQISIKVGGEGDSRTFLKFLETYQFKGGRLITIDSVNFSPKSFRNQLVLNFYTKNLNNLRESEILTINKKTIYLLKRINSELKFSQRKEDLEEKYPEYSVKADPFSL